MTPIVDMWAPFLPRGHRDWHQDYILLRTDPYISLARRLQATYCATRKIVARRSNATAEPADKWVPCFVVYNCRLPFRLGIIIEQLATDSLIRSTIDYIYLEIT